MLAFRVFSATACGHSLLVFFESVGVNRVYWGVGCCFEDLFLRMCVPRNFLEAIDVGTTYVDLWNDKVRWVLIFLIGLCFLCDFVFKHRIERHTRLVWLSFVDMHIVRYSCRCESSISLLFLHLNFCLLFLLYFFDHSFFIFCCQFILQICIALRS